VFHLNTEQLIDYWRAKRGAAPVPRRSAIDPTDMLNLVPQLFMLGRQGPGQYQVRLAGDFVTELHGLNLRGADFLGPWRADDRVSLQMALEAVRRRGEPLVLTCDARTEAGPPLRLEIALAPLQGAEDDVDRFIGLYQPLTPVVALDGRAVISLAIRGIETPDSDDSSFPRLRLAAMGGARVG
jgi:hypothetical protein